MNQGPQWGRLAVWADQEDALPSEIQFGGENALVSAAAIHQIPQLVQGVDLVGQRQMLEATDLMRRAGSPCRVE